MGLLRLQLAIAVFLFHIGLSSALGINILDGRAAVFCFFVVSGFYMEMVLTEKYNRERLGRGYAKMFYLSRFWRLYPTYLLVILATLVCTFFSPFVDLPKVLDFNQSTGWFETIRALLTWIFNLTMLFLNLPSTSDLLIGPGWSLGIEVAFYAIAPFVLRLKANALTVLALIGIALQFTPYGQHAPVFYGLHFFLLGALARRHSDQIEFFSQKIGNPPLWFLYVVTFVIIFCAIPNELYIGTADEHAHNTVGRLIYPIIVAALVPLLHERTKNSKYDGWIGHLSYPFYLVHTLIIALFSAWETNYKAPVLLVLCIGISSTFVILEMKYVDPWRFKFARPVR